jgi:uncharacterized protein YdaU (DUF1376 family)
MNYYERHIGDYLKATIMLTPEEEGIYNRLIDFYYSSEQPLPVDNFEIYKICRVNRAKYKKIIDKILTKYFHLLDGFWHHNRCDEEIAKYQEKLPLIEKKRENTKERQNRARDKRRALFDELRNAGFNPVWTSSTAQLEAMIKKIKR